MDNLHQIASAKERIDVIVHLTKETVVVQKQVVEMNGEHFTKKDAKKIEVAINQQQEQVIEKLNSKNIKYTKIHTYTTVLNAISIRINVHDIARVLSIKEVRSIEPDEKVKAMSLTNRVDTSSSETEEDPIYSEIKALWGEGLEGQGVKVAILDTGIDKNHPDLKEAYKGGINFIDQSNREKYICVRDDHDPSETSPDERPKQAPEKYQTTGAPFETYHGTHIAGIIAGKNTNGVKGIAPKIDLYAYRVLGAYTTGETSTIIKAIEEAVVQKMDIINLSLSEDSDSENHILSTAINNAVLAGVVAISTAGNAGSVRGSVRAPGTSRLGISVGNSNLSDEVDGSSSRGPSRPHFNIKPDIVAPGTEALSTLPRYGEESSLEVYKDAYKRETGTSQSAPYIAGVAALIKQNNPNFTPLDIKIAMTNTAKVLNTKLYNVFDQGAGRVQPYAAVHSSILAYSTEDVDINGDGKITKNRKGAITFGGVSLDDSVSITKSVTVKDIKGQGGVYNVTIDVTKPFKNTDVTVDRPSFTLNDQHLLKVTLTADKNENPKYRDEILGYIHIINQDKSIHVSLPFAADFSNGVTVKPEIETLNITKKDVSFKTENLEEVNVTLSITSDLSYPSLEITDYLSKEPVDSLYYSNGLSLGTRKFPILHKYTSSWTNENTILEDGIYSIDFTGIAKDEILTNSTGPVFIKSSAPIITGLIKGLSLEGQVKDDYIDFNQSLKELNEGFDLNDKLTASYLITREGKAIEEVYFLVNQDGSYTAKLSSYEVEKDQVTVSITDVAGNRSKFVLS